MSAAPLDPGRLLDVIERDVLPLTRAGVARGDKVFGAAVLRRADLSLVLAETNAETESPLWHGEVHALRRLWERAEAPEPKGLLLLSTHEPCTMCASAIAWAGIPSVAFLFSHEDSRDRFAIPHDLRILKELFGLEAGGWRRRNAFFDAVAIRDLIWHEPEARQAALRAQVARLGEAYAALSATYQAGKAAHAIPLA